jgi:hypothetical protein
MKNWSRAVLAVIAFGAALASWQHVLAGEPVLNLELRSRVVTDFGEFKPLIRKVEWNLKATAIIVCDMWDDHTCQGAAERVAEMAPAIDRTVKEARAAVCQNILDFFARELATFGAGWRDGRIAAEQASEPSVGLG